MHTPEHVMANGVEIGAGAAAVAAVVHALRGARQELLEPAPDGSPAPRAARVGMVGAVAGTIFALQMLNFPIGAATSGHLIGAGLAAVILGPNLAVLVVTAVLAVQALIFADGGLGALGVNVLLMAVVAARTASAVSRALTERSTAAGRLSTGRLTLASALGAAASVPAAALGWALLYALGGAAVPGGLSALVGPMLGWHLLVGVGEALITGVLVLALVSARPDLVRDARLNGVPAGSRLGVPAVLGATGVLALVSAGVLSRFAAPAPDGLEFVSANLGLDAAAGAHELLLADYGAVAGIDVGVAGVVGTAVTAALVLACAALITRRSPAPARA